MIRKIVAILLLAVTGMGAMSQEIDPNLHPQRWEAQWIQVPGTPAREYGVYVFRKTIELPGKRDKLLVHVSADNRYKLYVNGKLVSLGPARNDLYYWNYETVDIAGYLTTGKNSIAALVWNDGEFRPEGQISNRTGFMLQAHDSADRVFNSNSSWSVAEDTSYKPLTAIGYRAYYVAGPGEYRNMHATLQDWMHNDFDDSHWKKAATIGWGGAAPKGARDISEWMLVPSTLPQMELKPQRFASVRRSSGADIPASFPVTKTAFIIPSRTHAVILLDQAFLSNAYPSLTFSKGNNASISIGYAEALFDSIPASGWGYTKGNRDVINNKVFAGRRDSIVSNGHLHQQFNTLSYRTFRYVQLNIITKEEPLTIEDFASTFTGYPFTLNASLQAQDATLDKILEIGWRTARACAMDTYMDCPYYEQLQYIGDTRIQALVSLYNSGDDRLVRNAINQMDHSRIAEGITLSRHPSFSPQQIPTFSLWYIGMVHDYWMYRGDSTFVAGKMQGIRNVLWFFSKYQQPDGRLKGVPYWMFTDWVENRPGWSGGTAPYGKNGSSSILDLQLLWALQIAANLETTFGTAANAVIYNTQALQLQASIQRKYWDVTRQLYADTDDHDKFSQHANALAILTRTITGNDATALARRILNNEQLAPASIYFKYYLHMACVKAGLGNDYLEWLDIWRENIQLGMTTWAEISEISRARSDCHAWGSSPNIELFRVVLGIDTDAPGFSRVRIAPHLGNIIHISGSMPHPNGTLTASYQYENGQWKISIELPAKTTGKLLWKAKEYQLAAGINKFSL